MITKLLITGIVLTSLLSGIEFAYRHESGTQCAIRMVRLGLTQALFDYASADIATKRCVHQLNGPPANFIPYKPNNRNP